MVISITLLSIECLRLGMTCKSTGVPTFINSGELFWGNDSIPHLENFMLNQDSLNKAKFENFIKEYPFIGP